MTDCVFYENKENLQTILSFQETLEEKELIILFLDPKIIPKQALTEIKTTLRLKTAFLVQNAKEAMKNKTKYDYLIGQATRELIENNAVTHIIAAEVLEHKDKTHRRGSGLNQVTAKLIATKNKTYIYDLSLLLQDHLLLGRMQQNKRILDKYSAKQALFSMAREKLDVRSVKEREHFLSYL